MGFLRLLLFLIFFDLSNQNNLRLQRQIQNDKSWPDFMENLQTELEQDYFEVNENDINSAHMNTFKDTSLMEELFGEDYNKDGKKFNVFIGKKWHFYIRV